VTTSVNAINLIPAPRRRAAACRARLHRWVAGCVSFGAALLLVCMACHAVWGRERRALADEIEGARLRIRKSNQTILSVCRTLASCEWRLASCRAVGKQPDWSVLPAMLSASLGDDIVLERCGMRVLKASDSGARAPSRDAPPDDEADAPKQFIFEITGFGRSQLAVSRFILSLEKIRLFDRVRLIKTGRQPFLRGKAVGFKLECLLGGKGGR